MKGYTIAKLLISLASERFRNPQSIGKIRKTISDLDENTLPEVIKNIELISKETETSIEKNGPNCAAGQEKKNCEYLLAIIEIEAKALQHNTSPTA